MYYTVVRRFETITKNCVLIQYIRSPPNQPVVRRFYFSSGYKKHAKRRGIPSPDALCTGFDTPSLDDPSDVLIITDIKFHARRFYNATLGILDNILDAQTVIQ